MNAGLPGPSALHHAAHDGAIGHQPLDQHDGTGIDRVLTVGRTTDATTRTGTGSPSKNCAVSMAWIPHVDDCPAAGERWIGEPSARTPASMDPVPR